MHNLENARMENLQLENDKKCICLKMTEIAHLENDGMENAQPGKWWKSHILEIERK